MLFWRVVTSVWPWSILIWLVLFAGTTAPTQANNFYGTGLLKPMVKENETTIHILGGAKLAIQADETKYSLTDHLGSTRLAIASDHEVSRAIDYTPFGNSPTNATTETDEANQYTGMTFESETATYDYHARAYDPSVARFTGLDRQREDASPYVYVGNNPIAFVDRTGNGRIPFFIRTGIITDSGQYQSSYRLHKELAKLSDPASKTRFFDSDHIFDDVQPLEFVKTLNGEIYRLIDIITEKDSHITLNNQLFWFVGDDKNMSETSKNNLEVTLNVLRSVKKDLAENIVLLDFSTKDDSPNLETVKGALKEMNLPFEVMKRIYQGPKSASTYEFRGKFYVSIDDLSNNIHQSLKQPADTPETTTPGRTLSVSTHETTTPGRTLSVSTHETTTPGQTLSVSIPETTTLTQTTAVQTDLSNKIQSSSRGTARPHPYKLINPRQPKPLFTQNDF